MKKETLKYNILSRPLIILAWIVVWELAARALDNSIILVGPIDTLKALAGMLRQTEFYLSILNTLLKIGAGLLLASVFGVVLGCLGFCCPVFCTVMEPLIMLMKAIPVASFVILALIWLRSSSRLATFVSFIVVFPGVLQSTEAGLSAAPANLIEMAEVFSVGPFRRLRYIYLPALVPYLRNCFETAVGMCWKSGIAAELIGQPDHTIGAGLYRSKIFLDTPSLFAWTLVIIGLSVLSEKAVLALLKDRT